MIPISFVQYFVQYKFVEITKRYGAKGCQACQGGYHLSEMRLPKLPGSSSGASSRSEDSEYLPYVQWLGATMGWSSLHLIISTLKPMNQRLETIAMAMTSLEHSNILM